VKLTDEMREYFRELGRKGGRVKSEAKAKAAKRNGRKPKTAKQSSEPK